MHTWYTAVCDEHKEMIYMFVNNPKRTYSYLGDDFRNQIINDWFSKHYGCKLRLVHDDVALDKCYDSGIQRIKVL